MKPPEKLGFAMAMGVTQLLGCASQPAEAEAPTAVATEPSPEAGNEANAATEGATTASVDLVHCYGVNQCKGHNDCKTAENACAGQAECKTHGFVGMSEKACGDVGGEVKDDYRGEMSSADLIHCFGVNQCKGHNDCKTAENACAGHAACKGHGFVAMTKKACSDLGGSEEEG